MTEPPTGSGNRCFLRFRRTKHSFLILGPWYLSMNAICLRSRQPGNGGRRRCEAALGGCNFIGRTKDVFIEHAPQCQAALYQNRNAKLGAVIRRHQRIPTSHNLLQCQPIIMGYIYLPAAYSWLIFPNSGNTITL
jgi:hypothetical protein